MAAVFSTTLCLQAAHAQGLIWRLSKEENFSVLYQTQQPPGGNAEAANGRWTRELQVKSLKREKGYFNGEEVDCRWLEFVLRMGEYDSNRQGDPIDTGPAGRRIFKVLVPESRIVGKTRDADGIFVSMIPVATTQDGKIQGFKQIGRSAPVRMKVPVLQVYPLLTLLHHYQTLTLQPGQKSFQIGVRRAPQTRYTPQTLSPDQYKKYTAQRLIESRTRQVTNRAVISLCEPDRVPTGLLAWEVTVTHKAKDAGQKRSEFQKVAEVTSRMVAKEISYGDAQSLLPDLNNLP